MTRQRSALFLSALSASAALGGCQWKMPETENEMAAPRPSREPSEDDVRRDLMTDPAIIDARALPGRWDIYVIDDGTRRDALALRICGKLADVGLLMQQFEIRVIDRATPGRIIGHAFCSLSSAMG